MSDTELRDGCYPFHGGTNCERVVTQQDWDQVADISDVRRVGPAVVSHQPKGYREPHPVTGSGRLCSTCLRRRPANG